MVTVSVPSFAPSLSSLSSFQTVNLFRPSEGKNQQKELSLPKSHRRDTHVAAG